MILTPSDLRTLTGYARPSRQIRWLRKMGLNPAVRPDGTPAVTWAVVNAALTKPAPVSGPQWSKASV